YTSCSLSGRISCGPTDSSASVTALIAISSRSSPEAIRLRKIMMLMSSRPRRTSSPVISTSGLICSRVLIGPERPRVNHRSGTRHGTELGPGHEPAALPQWHQLADAMTITDHREDLPALDRIHDLLGPHPQVALGDLGLSAHGSTVAPVATACYRPSVRDNPSTTTRVYDVSGRLRPPR